MNEPRKPDRAAPLVWGLLLVAAYTAMAIAASDRTLIPDEIRPLLLGEHGAHELLAFAREDLVQTPLSYLATHAWLEAFGRTDAAAKAFAGSVGAVTILAFSFLAARMLEPWRIAALLFALAWMRVGSAVNLVRMYGLALLFVVSAFLFFERWRRSEWSGWLVAFALSLVLLFYSHLSGLLMVPAFLLVHWLYGPPRWRPQLAFLLACALALAALLPWVVYVAPIYYARGIGANVEQILDDPTRVLSRLPFFFLSGELAGGQSPPLPLHAAPLLGGLTWSARVLHLVLVVAGWRTLRPLLLRNGDRAEGAPAGAAFLLCVIPVAVLYAYSLLLTPVLNGRYVLVALPGYFLLVTALGFAGGRVGRVALLGFLLPWLFVASVSSLWSHWQRPKLREYLEQVAVRVRPGDLLLCDGYMPIGYQVLWEWQRGIGRSEPIRFIATAAPGWIASRFAGEALDEMEFEGAPRVWLFHGHWPHRRAPIERLESGGFRLADKMGTDRIGIRLYVRDQHARGANAPFAKDRRNLGRKLAWRRSW